MGEHGEFTGLMHQDSFRPLETDFYFDGTVWVYKWADPRLVLTTESVTEYLADITAGILERSNEK